MPYGVSTFCLVAGERSSLILPSFSLFPRWEFFIGGNLIWEDEERMAEDHFQTILYAKYMFYENEAKNAGFAVSFGTGGFPGYYRNNVRINSFRNYYAYFPTTIPLLKGTISCDLNPGVLADNTGEGEDESWEVGFTYSTRVAIYNIIPRIAIVGEIYGTAG